MNLDHVPCNLESSYYDVPTTVRASSPDFTIAYSIDDHAVLAAFGDIACPVTLDLDAPFDESIDDEPVTNSIGDALLPLPNGF